MKNTLPLSPLSMLFTFVLVFIALLAPFPKAGAFALPAKEVLKDVAKAKFFYQDLQQVKVDNTNFIADNAYQATFIDCALMKQALLTDRRFYHYNKLATSPFQATQFRRARDGLTCKPADSRKVELLN